MASAEDLARMFADYKWPNVSDLWITFAFALVMWAFELAFVAIVSPIIRANLKP